jgi:hypothetical protein
MSLTSWVATISRAAGARHRGREPLAQRAGEVLRQPGRERRHVGQVAGQYPGGQIELGVGQQGGQLGAGQPGVGLVERGERGVVGQHLQVAVQPGPGHQVRGEPAVHVDHPGRVRPADAQHGVLVAVVGEHQLGHLVGHRLQQRVASLAVELAGRHQPVEQDLDVDLVVGAVHPGRVVDRVGVDLPVVPGELDAAALGQPEVAALADDLDAQFGGVDPDGVVGPVADVVVGLGARLDVGADAAVPEQVGGGPQDRRDQLRRAERDHVVGQPERGPHRRPDRHRLGRARPHPAALADRVPVVVVPAGAGQLEQPPALGEAAGRVRVGIDEHVPVVERGQQPDVLGQQHPVAEHVTGHVADADHGELLGLGVHAELAEVPLDALPRALRGDPHGLVVVADRAARGERVAQPEAVGRGHLVGGVGELGGALVRRDHQVGVVAVVAHDVRRGHRHPGPGLLGDQVVGDVEQPGDERPVAVLDLGGPGVGAAHHEPALRAHRHDHRVLHRLRLDQAEDLGAVVLLAVRPAQPAAGDRAVAQVHALHPGRVHEDLEPRPRRRHVRHRGGVELEREVGPVAEPVGAQRGHDHREVAAEDAVGVQAGDRVDQAAPSASACPRVRSRSGSGRVEPEPGTPRRARARRRAAR